MTDNPTAFDAAASPTELAGYFNQASKGTLAERMGLELLEVAKDRIVARMPVEGNTQPYGLLHGGASVVLAETLGSIGAGLAAGPGRAAVGIEINATHHRAGRSGWVTGVATPISVGNTLVTYEIVIRDEDEKKLCTSRITCLLRDKPPGA
ncbi:PaaI family thioesterase [Nostocoides vanveenii]|uniref:Hotdog fold thioesterase n=2 Tax=Nostocoides TaxID=99479 RepID=A0ABP4WTY7_9MICO